MQIRQAAFVNAPEHFLKGGLHCHTTRSDGRLDPGETIRLHASHGYNFLALTDHRYYNFADYAPESGVLIVPGMEMDGNITTDEGMCFHTVCIGPEGEANGFRQDERFQSAVVKDQFEYQPVVDELRAKNNLVIYCHPDWSCTPARSFEKLEGCFAMEIWNSGCVVENNEDVDNGLIWDELLVRGKRIFAVATDDGHQPWQHCLGWVNVNAEKNVDSILRALESGAFYSSCGPEILDFYVEDGEAHLKCSPCKYIKFRNGKRPTRMLKNEDGLITEASMKLPECATYVRGIVEDAEGRRAWTNPIYLEK